MVPKQKLRLSLPLARDRSLVSSVIDSSVRTVWIFLTLAELLLNFSLFCLLLPVLLCSVCGSKKTCSSRLSRRAKLLPVLLQVLRSGSRLGSASDFHFCVDFLSPLTSQELFPGFVASGQSKVLKCSKLSPGQHTLDYIFFLLGLFYPVNSCLGFAIFKGAAMPAGSASSMLV